MTAVDFAGFVDRLAQVSGEVILPFFRSTIGAEDKSRGGVFDPVTEADRGAEAAMRRLIAQTFPAHGVIGEEYGQDRPDAEYVWVLDPIDGTKSFISGLPTWGTLIGLMHRGKPVYGMMAQPFTRERFFGDGKRAKLRCLAPSRGDAPPSEWTTPAPAHARLRQPRRGDGDDDQPGADPGRSRPRGLPPRRSQGAAHALRRRLLRLLRARPGFVDLVIETGLKPHDVVALAPIVAGAGGIMTTWEGGDVAAGGRIIAAGDARIYEEARRLLVG